MSTESKEMAAINAMRKVVEGFYETNRTELDKLGSRTDGRSGDYWYGFIGDNYHNRMVHLRFGNPNGGRVFVGPSAVSALGHYSSVIKPVLCCHFVPSSPAGQVVMNVVEDAHKQAVISFPGDTVMAARTVSTPEGKLKIVVFIVVGDEAVVDIYTYHGDFIVDMVDFDIKRSVGDGT